MQETSTWGAALFYGMEYFLISKTAATIYQQKALSMAVVYLTAAEQVGSVVIF
jgi:hypothetical protein